MGTDTAYVYGSNNGAQYDGESGGRTHWDPRISVRAIAHTVEVGIVPPTPYADRDGELMNRPVDGVEFEANGGIMEWFADNGQFLTLDRSGINRLIGALRDARDDAYGKDQ